MFGNQAQAPEFDDQGWTVRLRIPFSQLRFNPRLEQVWGLNINRYIPSTQEDLYWVLIPKRETGWASRFGELVGISGVRPLTVTFNFKNCGKILYSSYHTEGRDDEIQFGAKAFPNYCGAQASPYSGLSLTASFRCLRAAL